MRSLSIRLLLLLSILLIPSALLAHSVTISGTNSFAALDGSANDHDGVANGVFTVSDGDLVVNGVVNCNDDSGSGDSACAMAFNVSGDLTIGAGGALFAENRSGGGTGGAITLTVGRDLVLQSGAMVSSASKSSSGATGGNITATVARHVTLASGSTIDSGSSNAAAGKITVAAGGAVSVDGNVLAGPSRTILATRLSGAALDGGTANQVGGEIKITTSTFAEPALVVGSNANIISQGDQNGAGPVTLEGCGVQIKGLVAALSKKDAVAKVSIRSGKDLVIDARDLGVTGATLGRVARVRADAPTGTAINKNVELFAIETIDILGPATASSTMFPITALAGLHDSKSVGGLIRVISTGEGINASGNVIDDGRSAAGDTGGPIELHAKGDVNLNTAVIRSFGDSSTNNPARGGGSIKVRSYSGNVIWTNGLGDVRPTGSASSLPLADQGSIELTACGTVTTTGSSFPVNGSPTGVWPVVTTGACSPAAPSLPAGSAPLITCNTPPVANDASVSTNEDTTVTITLSGTDADGDPLTFSIVSGPSNGTLGAIIQVTPTSATVDYTPNANYNGGDSFVYQANDGNGGTDNATVTITVVAVNDPPTFQAGPTHISLEDAGPQTVTPWATSISPGPANEAGQTVTFTVTNSNPSLFSVQPSVSPSGTLTYTAAPNAYGSATITIVAQDNGGTANGGNDTSAPQTSSITVTPVNDAPSFTGGGDVTVNEDSGAYSAAWATGISAGPNESGQTVSFNVTNSNNALFSVQPAISASGVLTFTLAANANGSASVTVTLSDNGGTANGGVDTSAPQVFAINVTAVNDPPSFVSGGDQTVLEDSGTTTVAPWATSISPGPADESGQTVSFNVTATNFSLYSTLPAISPSGDLTFTVAPNAFGNSTVTVVAQDSAGAMSAPQTFTITVLPVNDAPSFVSGGNVSVNEDSGAYSNGWATSISAGPSNEAGQLLSFNVLSNSNAALFSVQPSISPSGVLTFTPAPNAFGSATLNVNLTDNGGTANGGVDTSGTVTFTITVNPVNDPPSATNDAYDTVGNTLLQVAAAKSVADPAVFVTGSVLANDNDIDSPGSLSATLNAGSVTPGAVVTMNADGSFTYLPPAGHPGATDSFSYTVSDGSASSSGTVTITLKGRVWYVRNDAAAGTGRSSEPFAMLSLAEAASGTGDTIFIFTGNGTVLNQNSGFTLQNGQRLLGQGVALTVPVSVNGGPNPTVLMAAGTKPKISNAGGNGVTGSGVSNVEVAGLEITGSLNSGISLANASAVKVSTVTITGNLDHGITGTAVNGFDLANSSVTNNGDNAVTNESQLSFTDLTGSSLISNSTFAGSVKDNVRIVNTAGVLNRVTFDTVTFGLNHVATGNDSVFLSAGAGTTFNVTIQGSTFLGARGDMFDFTGANGSVSDLVFQNNAVSNSHAAIVAAGGGVKISSQGTLTYSIKSNTFRDAVGTALLVNASLGNAVLTGRVELNQVGVAGVPNSGSRSGSGIMIETTGGGDHSSTVTGNTVRGYNNHGIMLQAGDQLGNPVTYQVTVTNNTVTQPGTLLTNFNGVHLNNGTVGGDSFTACIDIRNNALTGSGTGASSPNNNDIRLRQRILTTVRLPGYAGAANDNAAVQAFLLANNTAATANAANTVSTGGGGYIGGAACTTP